MAAKKQKLPIIKPGKDSKKAVAFEKVKKRKAGGRGKASKNIDDGLQAWERGDSIECAPDESE